MSHRSKHGCAWVTLFAGLLVAAAGCDATTGDASERGVPDEVRDLSPPTDGGDAEQGMPESGMPDADVGPPPDTGPRAGSEGGPCRGGADPCDDGLICLEGRCRVAPEGGEGEPCRAAEPACDQGLVCLDETCTDPMCEESCVIGQRRCLDDSTYQVCGALREGPCNAFGGGDDRLSVQCDSGRFCEGEVCDAPPGLDAPVESEVVLLVDRGGIGVDRWPSWRDAIEGWARAVQPPLLLGGRTFPGNAPCTIGAMRASTERSFAGLEQVLYAPDPMGEGRPLSSVMRNSEQDFRTPATEGRYAVLLTTGDETCDPEADLVGQIRYLRGRAIRVLVIHLAFDGAPADPGLEALGAAGGLDDVLGGVRQVATPEALVEALDAFAEWLEPACYDPDQDNHGPFCDPGADCDPRAPDTYAGAPELCDGEDNDCDTIADEAIEPRPARLTAGVCAGQVSMCVDAVWVEPDLALIDDYQNGRETRCDRLDNDCDGTVDEGIGNPLGACTVGTGGCARSGRRMCDPQMPTETFCNVMPGEPSPELCDQIDNDCDGTVDEGAPVGGDELCDGLDNDCDGTLDEEAVLGRCPSVDENERPVACVASACVVACDDGWRDRDGLPGCEAPAFADLALGNGFTCVAEDLEAGGECYGRATAPIAPADALIDIAAGGDHACFVVREAPGDLIGEVTCRGPDAAITAGSVARFGQIGVGDRIACGITQPGTVQCWGPDPASTGEFEPRGGIIDIAVGGRHVCARDEDGFVGCHGHCGEGCSGQGEVPDGLFFDVITAGLAHTCGIVRGTGTVRCWGAGDELCQLPACGENQGQSIPPPGVSGYRAIAAGALHTCAIDGDYAIRCWGDPRNSRLAAPAGRFLTLWAGTDHTCALRVDGRIRCWGRNVDGSTQPLD